MDGIEIKLHPEINFLVGENNLGKSNFLDMLEIVLNKRRFYPDDFTDPEELIKVELSIILDDVEQGVFDDLFDPSESSIINIVVKQEETDDIIRYFHKETEQEISYQKFRCLNFIKYDSLRSPREEITFHRGRGAGRFLNHLVSKYMESIEPEDDPLVSRDAIEKVTEYVNERLHKLKLFKDFMLKVGVEDDLNDLVHSILRMTDSKDLAVDKFGYGVQFSLLVTLSIMEQMLKVIDDKIRSQCIFEYDDGDKQISLILGLDEPEIHLHPYMQRSMIKYISALLENDDDDFLELIEDIFGVDLIDGQAIVVTHSPSVLLNNYKQIVRFYRIGNNVEVANGAEINLGKKTEKHLLKNFPYIKEAFFSRCIILVEGDSEFGAFPIFDRRLSKQENRGDFDQLGISVIQAGSADSIPMLMDLLERFKIPCVGIMDADKYIDYEDDDIENLFSTDFDDFEADIYDAFDIEDYIKYVEDINPDNRCFFMKYAIEVGIDIDCSADEIYPQFDEVDDDDLVSLKEKLEDSRCPSGKRACPNFMRRSSIDRKKWRLIDVTRKHTGFTIPP